MEHLGVEAMAAAIGAVKPEDRRAGEGEIANRIERLVPHELVSVTKAFRVQDAVVAN